MVKRVIIIHSWEQVWERSPRGWFFDIIFIVVNI